MDGFFRILQKRLSELICTRLYIIMLVGILLADDHSEIQLFKGTKILKYKASVLTKSIQNVTNFGVFLINFNFLQFSTNMIWQFNDLICTRVLNSIYKIITMHDMYSDIYNYMSFPIFYSLCTNRKANEKIR